MTPCSRIRYCHPISLSHPLLTVQQPAPEQYSNLFRFRQSRFNYSIETNPYFFFPQFAGVLVAPAGFAFPPAMMSNHSAQYPQGYLDKETFKSFFAVTGDSGNFKYQPGYERIPDNWYKRAIGTEYSIPAYVMHPLHAFTESISHAFVSHDSKRARFLPTG